MAFLRNAMMRLKSSKAPSLSDHLIAPDCFRLFSSNSNISPQNVGFVGLGNMGSHMANNLLKAGHHLTVYDRVDAAMRALAEKGASTAKSPREVADASDVLITMLPSSPHVEEVYTGPNGILSNVDSIRPSLLIDASTIDPLKCRTLAATVAKCTLSTHSKSIGPEHAPMLLDAPVSGGVVGAQAATLTFMVGGPHEGLQAAQTLLEAMGKRVVHCGGNGNGALVTLMHDEGDVRYFLKDGHKIRLRTLSSQSLAWNNTACISEALALGQQLGIDAHTLSNIFNSSSARCWSSDTYNPVPGVMVDVPSSRNYEGGFSCQLMTKDLGLALVAAEETGAAVPLAVQLHMMYTILCKAGHSSSDFSSVFHHYYKGEPEDAPADGLKDQVGQ